MSVRTPQEAIAWANKQERGYVGLCLQFVRHAYDVDEIIPTAAKAWAASKHKTVTASWSGVPKGALLHFRVPGVPSGHVAIYLGDGLMRTNLSHKGTINTVSVKWYLSFAKATMVGWTRDVNNVVVVPYPVVSRETYTVKPGDTLSAIALKNKTTVARLAGLNKIANPNRINVGLKLRIK